MEKPVLVVMAAGMGSRYGGLKQMEPVGPCGEMIIDYSVHDAKMAGFEKVIFIIKREIKEDFCKIVGGRISPHMQVAYAYQELGDLPQGYALPPGRQKPWGTTHAVLCAQPLINGPFAVINADDYYGPNAFRLLYAFLAAAQKPGGKNHFAMVGYNIENTLTDKGTVARGVCQANTAGFLTSITERLKIAKAPQGAQYTLNNGASWLPLPAGTLVSMNFWGLTQGFLAQARAQFPAFLDENLEKNPEKCEFLLPRTINSMMQSGTADVKVLQSGDVWQGVTYKEDKPQVVAALAQKHSGGQYKTPLWGA